MRLLSLDYDPVYGNDATRASFSSDVSVFDYDAVIWNPAETLRRYTTYAGDYRGLPSLSDSRSVELVGDVTRRRQEFLDFLDAGKPLVVIVGPPQECYIDTGQRTHSGTGRNRTTTIHVDRFDLWSAMPVGKLTLERASGSRVALVGEGPVTGLLRKYANFLGYEAVMKTAPGSVIAKVQGTDRVVGSVTSTKAGGHLLLLPAMNWLVDGVDGDDDWTPEAEQFQEDLLANLGLLSDRGSRVRPTWANQYSTTKQRQLRTTIVAQQTQIEEARAKFTELQSERERAEAPDQLFLGSGRALELEVAEVFKLLGGTLTEPDPGRDDWKVTFPEGACVVEVKGVKKSAAEKHAAQLEKWVAAAYEETSQMPKGILVVNTWRETPLTGRTGDDFPSQMLPYSEGRGHCLVTGLQFFVIRADLEKNPKRAAHWRKVLMEAKGTIETGDWRTILEEERQEAAESSDGQKSDAASKQVGGST